MKALHKLFKKFFAKKDALGHVMAQDGRIKEHFNGMEEGTITVDNWRDHFTIQGHGSEIKAAHEIFGTPQDTKDLELQAMGLDANTAAWTYMALEWMHAEQEDAKEELS